MEGRSLTRRQPKSLAQLRAELEARNRAKLDAVCSKHVASRGLVKAVREAMLEIERSEHEEAVGSEVGVAAKEADAA